MASQAHHAPPQHPRYPLSSMPQPSRDDPLRLPSLKDLNFHHPPANPNRHGEPFENSSSSYPPQADYQPSNRENSTRHPQSSSWSRAVPQTQAQSPSPMSIQAYQHQQHQHQHQHQQHTPPLSATSHESSHSHSKYDYPQKHDNGFLTPGIPLSAQSTPVPGAVNSGPGTRVDDGSQAKRRRSSDNMHAGARDPRSPHTAFPQYAYPSQPPPPPQNAYQHQAQPSLVPNSGQPGQPAVDPINQVSPPNHPSYNGYQQQQYIPNRMPPQTHQSQIPHGNPYPSPGPPSVHPPGPWEQPSQPQPHHPQHAPPVHPAQHHSQPPARQTPQQPPSHHHTPAQPPPVPQHHLQPVPHHHQPPAPQPQPVQQPPPPPPQPQNPPFPTNQGYPSAYAPAVHSNPPPPPQGQQVSHPPPPQPQQTQQQAQPQQPQQQHQQHQQQQAAAPQQMTYSRPSAVTPSQIDTRVQYPIPIDRPQDSTMAEIIQHCNILYQFANKYAHIQQTEPDVCPSQEELSEMSHRAQEVVRLLEEYRRMNLPESERTKVDNPVVITPPDDHRPPKRPWEDTQDDSPVEYPTPTIDNRTTAEQDMDIIRNKRATSTAGGAGAAGQPKSKYRKRSRATPPGKCHSCNIRETPEWRRGPDGARTLCNACGLHYAKLQRKREKLAGPDGEVAPIDLDTLRASARAAEANKESARAKARAQQNGTLDPSDPTKTLPHTGSFQLISVNPGPAAQETPPVTLSEPHRIPPPPPPHQLVPQHTGPLNVAPPPPWPTTAMNTGPRGYPPSAAPDQLQHQSFLRTPHSIMNDASPR